MAVEVPSMGPRDARIMIVGEAPGKDEVERGLPFCGISGLEMTRMLEEAGFNRSECYVTNVCRVQPPGNDIEHFFSGKTSGLPTVLGRYARPEIHAGLRLLEEDIRAVNPDLILAFGNTALWACTGNSGITKWRGSVLESRVGPTGGADVHGGRAGNPKVIPTYHPAAILRNWSWRYVAVHDLRRARQELDTHGRTIVKPAYQFKIRPSYEQTISYLSELQSKVTAGPTWVACDVETLRRRMDCIGFATSSLDAFCIPFISMDGGFRQYWSLEEHTEIILRIRALLTHPNCKVIGQNFPYDSQYIAWEWGFIPNLQWDTMTIHHSIFCLLPRALDFQSSLYCDFHQFWKEDAKDEEGRRLDDESHWIYNCRDNVVTYEIREKQEILLGQLKFPSKGGETPQQRQMSFHQPVLKAMLRGVLVSTTKRAEVLADVQASIEKREKWIETALGHPLNPRSPPQLKKLFYKDFDCKPIISRKTKAPTCDDEALTTIGKRSPLLAPICEFINDVRSLGTHRAVCQVPLRDGRIRCSYAIPGTDTYRFASKSDAFGYGTNLQNITSGTEDIDPEMLEDAIAKGVLLKPNLRKLLVPDPGYTLVEYDLPQADAQVVAWDSGDAVLKAIFRDPLRDLHTENAIAIFGSCSGKGDPRRQLAKIGVHAVNYGATPFALAPALGITKQQAQEFIDKWFAAHPEIVRWHTSIRNDIERQRYIENAFGYRRYCFDRIESDFKEALAWKPQSTVAIITNTGLRQVDRDLGTHGVQFLLQVHDSAVFQIWTADGPKLARDIRDRMVVTVPYEDPLEMVPEAKFSDHSWGECKKRPEWLKAA
jgi:DNA polymerase I-like protein with 3'-5' exonuclease and polymerase domains/uracil-DNA glycosylase